MHPLVRNNAFVRLFVGRIVSNAGDSIYFVAATWLVYELTGSTFFTGLASSLVMLPAILQFAVGPIVDDVSVRKVLVATQTGQMLLVLTIPVAAALDVLTVGLVLIVIPLAELLNQFTHPAQSSALSRAVEQEHLATANSWFSAAREGVDMTFNAVGGVLVGLAAVGAVGALLVDAGTFAVAVLLFAGLRLPPRSGDEDDDVAVDHDSVLAAVRSQTREYVDDFRDGVSYLRGTAFLPIMLPEVFINFASGMMIAVLPAFATLRGGSGMYGVLLSAMAAGALIGSLLASRVDHVPYGYVLIGGAALTGVTWVVITLTSSPIAVVALFVVAVIFPGGNSVLFDTLIQTVVAEDMVGRTTSTIMTVRIGATPIGSFLGGIVGASVGPVPVLLAVGVANFLGVAYFARSESLRELPAIASVERGDERIENFAAGS